MKKLSNRRIKKHDATCMASCNHFKVITRKNGDKGTCGINRKDLPKDGRFRIPYWCPIITTYYSKKANKNKRRKRK